eukprot:Gb_36396 [translate_table: standard]
MLLNKLHHLLTAQMNLKASLIRISCALIVIIKVTLKRTVGRRKQIKRKRLNLLLYLLMTRKPSFSNLRVFGCITFVHVPDKKRQNLDDKSHKCILVGYSESSKAYRLWDPSQRKIVISRDVLFDESNEGIVPIVNADAKGKEVNDETDEKSEKSEEIFADVPSSSSSLKPLPKWYTQTIKDSKVENIDTSIGVQTQSKVNFALMSNVLNTNEPESFAEDKDASHW